MTEKENRKEEMRSLKDAGCDDTFITNAASAPGNRTFSASCSSSGINCWKSCIRCSENWTVWIIPFISFATRSGISKEETL